MATVQSVDQIHQDIYISVFFCCCCLFVCFFKRRPNSINVRKICLTVLVGRMSFLEMLLLCKCVEVLILKMS